MNVGDRIPEILGIDQDGREIKASDKSVLCILQQDEIEHLLG